VILAIETSCDETAVALFDLDRVLSGASFSEALLANEVASSAELHKAYGGIVPELAAREQTLTLPPLVDFVLSQAGINSSHLRAVAATSGPGLNGSLLVGLSYAKGLSYALKIPLLPVNHLEGHLCAHLLLKREQQLASPYLSLLVSGGHTEIILEGDRRITVSRTRDDAAGEAFDKCATLLGLPYPGGPQLSRLAEQGDRERFKFPIGLLDDSSAFSFSGLKTAVMKSYRAIENPSEQDRCDLAASVEQAIVEALSLKTLQQAETHKVTGVFLTGGVAANSYLRQQLKVRCEERGLKLAVAPLQYCTDNAAMIGAAALRSVLRDRSLFLDWTPSKANELGPNAPFTLGTRTSWSVSE